MRAPSGTNRAGEHGQTLGITVEAPGPVPNAPELTILTPPQQRRFLPDLRKSLGGLLLLAPCKQGSVHRRSGLAGSWATWCFNAGTWFLVLRRQRAWCIR